MAKFPSLVVVLTAVTVFSHFSTVTYSAVTNFQGVIGYHSNPCPINCQYICISGTCSNPCPSDCLQQQSGHFVQDNFRDGWKQEWSCKICGLDVPTLTCDSGKYINLKTIFYGRLHKAGEGFPSNCSDGAKKELPHEGCNIRESHINAINSKCQGKQTCGNWNWPSEVCPNWHKYNNLWYDCVAQNLLTQTKKLADNSPVCCNVGVNGGYDIKGETLLVGRTYHKDHLLPCYIARGKCIFAIDGKYGSSPTFEYLDPSNLQYNHNYKWTRTRPGQYPGAATVFGQTKAGVALLVGRTEIDGGLYVGNVDTNSGLLSVGYGGRTFVTRDYEVLML